MKKIIFLVAFAGILFSTCKKEDPKPAPAPVQKKLMVYVKNFPPTENLIFLFINKSTGEEWMGGTETTYGSTPPCGSSGTFTIDVINGGTYEVMAVCALGDHIWGPTTYIISSDCTAIPIN